MSPPAKICYPALTGGSSLNGCRGPPQPRLWITTLSRRPIPRIPFTPAAALDNLPRSKPGRGPPLGGWALGGWALGGDRRLGGRHERAGGAYSRIGDAYSRTAAGGVAGCARRRRVRPTSLAGCAWLGSRAGRGSG